VRDRRRWRGVENGFRAPASGDCDRDEEGEGEGERDAESESWLGPGEGGRLVFGGAWNGRSVGEMYLALEGPASVGLGSSAIGVMGGGGVMGVDVRNGDETMGSPVLCRGRRERCEPRDEGTGDEAPGVPFGELSGLERTRPPTSNKMLPRSLPYAGGGASVPTLGAKPHFLTLASTKTKPA